MSESRMVLRRWAMVITVRPFISRSSASITSRSDSVSRAAVGSSRIKNRRVANNRAGDSDALPLASRNGKPSLADQRVVAMRHSTEMKSWALASFAASIDLGVRVAPVRP